MARKIDRRSKEWKDMKKQLELTEQQRARERMVRENAGDILAMLAWFKSTVQLEAK